MYERKFWLHQEQPNLAYADVNLNIACTQGDALYVYTTISVVDSRKKFRFNLLEMLSELLKQCVIGGWE